MNKIKIGQTVYAINNFGSILEGKITKIKQLTNPINTIYFVNWGSFGGSDSAKVEGQVFTNKKKMFEYFRNECNNEIEIKNARIKHLNEMESFYEKITN